MEERVCPECEGKGVVPDQPMRPGGKCGTCQGSGRIGGEDYSGDVAAAVKGAWDGLSWTPEDREKQFIKDYNLTIWAAIRKLDSLAKTPAQRELAGELFDGFRSRCRQLAASYLAAKSRVISSAIAGPANFPAARMQKRADTEHKRLKEWLNFLHGSDAYFEKRMRGALTPEERETEDNSARWNHLRDEVLRVAAVIINPEFYDPNLFRRSLAEKIRRSPEGAAIQALDLIRHIQKQKGIVIFAPNNAVWKAAGEIAGAAAVKAARPAEVTLHQVNGLFVVRNNAIERLQIRFPGKPEEEVRSRLKAHGFHWSPRECAWQRKLTTNAEFAAMHVLGIERWINGGAQ